jgi:hypothetical protein
MRQSGIRVFSLHLASEHRSDDAHVLLQHISNVWTHSPGFADSLVSRQRRGKTAWRANLGRARTRYQHILHDVDDRKSLEI